MTKHIDLDCRGLACPGPVLKTMDAVEKDAPDSLTVAVDDQASLENVSRLLSGKGYAVAVQAGPNGMAVSATRGAAPRPGGESCAAAVAGALGAGKTLVFLTADGIGTGSDELGGKLMLAFLSTLPELGAGLWRIILVNAAVRLACEGNPALEKLQALAANGVTLLVCGTCLNHYGLMETKRVGETTNMLDVVTSLGLADKVIQL